MTYNLTLGFRSKPLDLTEVLQGQGFELKKPTVEEESVEGILETRSYSWFDQQTAQVPQN